MAFSPNPLARHPTRGFASLTPDERRAIAAKGGRALKPEQRSFSKNRDLASAAGRKGGTTRRAKPTLD